MNWQKCLLESDLLKRNIYSRCKELKAKIAIVGSLTTAWMLLDTIKNTDIDVQGVYEINVTKKSNIHGYEICPIEKLKELGSKDIIILASSALSTDLYDTINLIESICPNKVIHFSNLIDLFTIQHELLKPLDYHFGNFLFGRGFFPKEGENPHWHPIPPNVDFKDKTVLELGPFEGNNSIMIMKQKPRKVIALEFRPLHYAKTSVTKSLYDWQNYSLVLGDMHLFPGLINEKIDIIYNSGVLYHSPKPWWLLKTCMDHCDTIVLSTYVSSQHSSLPRKFSQVKLESGTYDFELFPEPGHLVYGLKGQSLWFKEDDLIQFIEHHGFTYNKYNSVVVKGTGLWIFSVLKKKI